MLGIVSKYKIKIPDSETIFGTAYKNSMIDTVILMTKRKIQIQKTNRKVIKVTNIAEIKYEVSVQLQYENILQRLRGHFQYCEQKYLDTNVR